LDFTPTDDQRALRDAARAMLAKECPPTLLRAHLDDRAAVGSLWRHLAGWTEVADGPLVDLCVLQEELGRVAAPGPMLAHLLARSTGADTAGDGVATVAMAGGDGEWRANAEPVKTFVLDVDLVDRVVIIGLNGDGPTAVVADTGAFERRELGWVDSTRRVFEITVPPTGMNAAAALPPSAIERLLHRGWVAVAAEQVGTAARLLDMTLAYVRERVQFGKPIGAFQAVQHKVADMALDLERATAATYYAAMTVDAGDGDRHRAVHVAKAAAGRAAHRCATEAIQLHGGIGFTWEHDLHLYIRRALAAESLLGTPSWHHDRLGELLLT
jgi:alkylation response protein AidB-like acyl-CoA dehydrogenase